MWRITLQLLSNSKPELQPNCCWALRRIHSAALALPSRRRNPSEIPLFQLQLGSQIPSNPPISDVRGTLNTVLWGIPWIANQMCLKLPEGDFIPTPGSCPPHFLPREFVFAVEDNLESSVGGLLSEQANRLSSQKKNSEEAAEFQRGKLKLLRERQIKIESEAWQRAVTEYKETLKELCKNELAPNLPFMKSMFLGWFEPLRDAIAAEQEAYRNGEYLKYRNNYGPFMCLLSADKLAVITMHKTIAKLMTDIEHGGLRVVAAALNIADAVEQEVILQHVLKKSKRKKGEKDENLDDEAVKAQLAKHKALQKEVKKFVKQKRLRILKKMVREAADAEPWSKAVQAKLGSRLLELFIETACIQDPGGPNSEGSPELRPAFRHIFKSVGRREGPNKTDSAGRRYGVVECDPYISRGIHKMARGIVTPYMPMLVKPLPWQGYRKGGHLVLPSCIMRTHGARELGDTLKRTPKRQMRHVFEALDTLGSTKWRINTSILEVAEKIWAEGGRIADMVDRDDVPLPEKPDTDVAEVLKKWKWDHIKAKRMNRELHSQRCDTELKLAVARRMKDEDIFYYPHNIDFRGRAYPMHPHLNHLGSDMCRGFLEFGEGRPLGSRGLYWLKIHLANLFGNGVDKLSYDDRVAFVEENMHNIFDSAMRPLAGGRWWLGAEDPFQSLATCKEIFSAITSGSPESYVCHLPVHQDGSCNGLQHYAALGRDVLGAESVNLTVQEKPADVYSDIAVRVRALLEQDLLKDSAVDTDAANASILQGQVDRKLVKQTVMTSVYGVTYIGARDQILHRLNERHTKAESSEVFAASCYAAKKTLTALGEMFKDARIIMGWLGDCAKIIASQNKPVTWTTPLGLPVVQPYRKSCKVVVKTSLQILAINHSNDTKVLVKRQRTAFPPNFVHSLDGTHMMMTANACKKAGLTFAGVHDSFWTHAGDVDKMNMILREKFVELYNQPILENLLKDFQRNFPEANFPPVPNCGDFDLQEVLHAPYFFN